MEKYKIDIPSPCPMSLNRIQNSGYNCGSCAKKIIDCRGMKAEEIRDKYAGKNICGIFDTAEVKKRDFSIWYKVRFAFLTIVAVVGINVKPIQAQNQSKSPRMTEAQRLEKRKEKEIKKSIDKTTRNWFRRRNKIEKKTEFRTIGCPSF